MPSPAAPPAPPRSARTESTSVSRRGTGTRCQASAETRSEPGAGQHAARDLPFRPVASDDRDGARRLAVVPSLELVAAFRAAPLGDRAHAAGVGEQLAEERR